MPARTIYRDRATGQFVSKATWTRSRARGGKRYARQRVTVEKKKPEKKKKRGAPPPVTPGEPICTLDELEEFIEESDEELEEIEFEGAFDSP